tara:strand:- start:766 stop:1842 length:1077 start_codon:yes stop_codon:yes gene_type:complete
MALTQVTQAGIGDQAVSLDKLLHGTSSNNGKFLRANNGADPTFETIDLTSLDASNLSSGTIPSARLAAADLLTLIKTVDGAGSGLDADTLDGQSSSYYENANNLLSGTIPPARFGSGNIPTTAIALGALPTNVTVASANIVNGSIVDADISGSAAIQNTKIATGLLPSGITVNSSNIVDGSIVNADVNASAAIAGTKIDANFGSQNIQTTGNLTVGGTITGVTTNTATDIQTNASNNVAPVFKNSAGVEIARLVKAYVNFNGQSSGTNKTIRDSFNVTSVTDQAVGYYQVNFDRAMADANYSALVTGDLRSPNTRSSGTDCNFYSTTLCRVSSEDNNAQYGGSRADVQILCVCILGNT